MFLVIRLDAEWNLENVSPVRNKLKKLLTAKTEMLCLDAHKM